MNNYVCRIASPDEMERRWDDEISLHTDQENWIAWKGEAIRSARAGRSVPYYGFLGEAIICEATAILNPGPEAGGETGGTAELCAFRTLKEYRGKGYFSKLMDFMLKDLKRRGYRRAVVGVEPCEKHNMEIYRHWGFDEYVGSATETYPDGTVIDVLFYGKAI